MTPGSEVTIKALKKGFEVLWGDADTVQCEAEAAFTKLDEALAFIRSRMEPEGEGEKGWGPFSTLKDTPPFRLSDVNPVKSDTREPRRFMDEPADAEPAWKRAKVGDWVQISKTARWCPGEAGEVVAITEYDDGMRLEISAKHRGHKDTWHVFDADVHSILPKPPRHGDFGSMGEGA